MDFEVRFHDGLSYLSQEDESNIVDKVVQFYLDNSDDLSVGYDLTYNGKELYVGYIENEAYVMPDNEEITKQFVFWKLEKEGTIKVVKA